MRLYLDDDLAWPLLARLLVQAGHDVQLPVDVGMQGVDDPIHLAHAVRDDRIILTGNHHDFENLQVLIEAVRGQHPGIFAVRKDNDPSRDLKPPGIVRAIRNLELAAIPIRDVLHVLNQWR